MNKHVCKIKIFKSFEFESSQSINSFKPHFRLNRLGERNASTYACFFPYHGPIDHVCNESEIELETSQMSDN